MTDLITPMIAIPLLGAVLQIFWVGKKTRSAALEGWSALAASVLSSAFSLALVFSMRKATPEFQATEYLPWIESYGISYSVGVDGLSILLVLLVAIVFPFLLISQWSGQKPLGGMYALFLMLQASINGVLCSRDLFLLFFFWAVTTIPIYFLIAVWGDEEADQAAFQFMVTSAIGNALFFVALVFIYHAVDPSTFSLEELSGGRLAGKSIHVFGQSLSVSKLSFFLLTAGLALRIPIWPIHGWFSYVTTQARASVVVVLASVVAPAAIYVFSRLSYTLFPGELSESAEVILIVGAVNFLLGSLAAIAQKELRLLLAHLSIGQIGLMLIGIATRDARGVVGSVFQQLSIGLALAGFGLFLGMLRDRYGHSAYRDETGKKSMGGVAKSAPVFAVLTGAVIASILGFPGSGGFVGQSLIMMGGYMVHPWVLAVTGLAVVLTTYCLFHVFRSVFLGVSQGQAVTDLSLRERGYFYPLVALLLYFGFYPKPLLELIRPSILTMISLVN